MKDNLDKRTQRKGSLIGVQKIKMLEDYWIPEGKGRSCIRSIFECPFCKTSFEASVDHIKRARTEAPISCGCQLNINKYRVGQKIGEHQVEILELYPVEKTKNSHKDRKAKFKCKDCEEPFICSIKQVAKYSRKSCGCTSRKQKLKESQVIKGIKVLAPNIRRDKASSRFVSKFECPFCKTPFEWQNTYIRNGYKTSCGCQDSKSYQEDNLYIFVKSLINKEVIANKRILDGKEIDVYIEDLQLGFEYNGLYWHSEARKMDKNYHLNKTNLAKEKGIELVHIFEHLWMYKQEIVKDLIKKKLNITKKVFARKCTIVEVTSKEAREFIDNNHLQGYTSSKIKYGLRLNGELISIMTFGESRFSNKYDYELIRFCNKIGTSVIGGASKLLKHFEKTHKGTLVSYCDKTIFNGSLYESLGFKKSHDSKPNYFYFKQGTIEVHNRQKFMKHKLKDKLQIFDPTLTEYENMANNKYLRYWDCGNAVYTKQT